MRQKKSRRGPNLLDCVPRPNPAHTWSAGADGAVTLHLSHRGPFAAVAHKNGGTALIRGRKRAMQHSGQIAAVGIAGEQRDAGRKTGKPPGKRQHPPQERLIFAPPPQEHRLAQHRAEPFRSQAGKGFLRVLLPGRGVQAGTADRCAGKAGARFPLQLPERTAEAHEEQGRLPRAHVRRRAAGRLFSC